MRPNMKGHLAVNAMIDIALRNELGAVPLVEVASRQRVSLSYLEQLFSKLRLKGLVTSVRGPGGGYLLGRSTDGITVADIICAVEESPPLQKNRVASLAEEMTQDLWDEVNAKALSFTQAVTLRSLVFEQLANGVQIQKTLASPNRGVFKKPTQQSSLSNIPNSVFALGATSRAALLHHD